MSEERRASSHIARAVIDVSTIRAWAGGAAGFPAYTPLAPRYWIDDNEVTMEEFLSWVADAGHAATSTSDV